MEEPKYNWFIGRNHYNDFDTDKELDLFINDTLIFIKASKLQAEKEEALEKLRHKEDAEKKAKEAEEAKIQSDLNKGDSEMVNDLIEDLNNLKEKYEGKFKSKKNQKMFMDVKYLLDKVVNHIQK